MTAPVCLSDELVEFLESGVSIAVASRDEALRPMCARGLGLLVGADRRSLTVFLNAEVAGRMRADFDDNGRIAVAVSRIIDHRSLQLKGVVLGLRAGTPEEHQLQQQYLAAFAEQVALAGLARSVVRNLRLQPSLAVQFEVHEIFDQTPGAGAGRRVEAP